MNKKSLSYKEAGVDIDEKNKTFEKINSFVSTKGANVLNTMGAFASLIDLNFPDCQEPVLVFKLEEPGTKQKLALQYGTLNTVAHDMINHLVDDIIVMGARPIAVQDLIVCGKLKDEIITPLIRAMSEACANNDCSLVGGETSEQPGVVSEETHILGASIIGIVDKAKIIDGHKIKAGDKLIAFASNGLHTNGYSLVRKLIEQQPEIINQEINGEKFIDAVLRPHKTYWPELKGYLGTEVFNGLAHITGGGIEGNLSRIIPNGLSAEVALDRIQVLPLFKFIQNAGHVLIEDMLRTFNMGTGIIAVVSPENENKISNLAGAYTIGKITDNKGKKVNFKNTLNLD